MCRFFIVVHKGMLNLLVKGFGGLVTTRFLMGIAEAGVFPGCEFFNAFRYQRDD